MDYSFICACRPSRGDDVETLPGQAQKKQKEKRRKKGKKGKKRFNDIDSANEALAWDAQT